MLMMIFFVMMGGVFYRLFIRRPVKRKVLKNVPSHEAKKYTADANA